ncbi:MAG: LysR family transcriptional regulator [Pseudonocardiales bacterium]|nr:MAG: LysR family transcriptional regulator [Pseudonocardiales bacterium]
MPNDGQASLDVGRLRLLREVALRGTIAAAARSLGLTASAVSQQLAVLEREAGTALMDRSPRGVVLTGAGRLLAGRAVEVLEVLASARADLDRIGGSVAGPVGVAAVASAAATFVSGAVAALRSAHPDIVVGVTAAEPSRALALLVAGDVDVAVVDEYDYVPLALPEFAVVRELRTEPLVCVGPSGSFGRRRPALAELAAHDWVMPPDDAACGLAVRSACRAEGFEPRVRWETDDMLVLVRAIEAGHGIAVLPRLAVADAVADVAIRSLRQPQLERRLIAVARASALGRPVIGTVFDAIVTAVTRRPHKSGTSRTVRAL